MSKLLAKLTQNTSFDLASSQMQETSLVDVFERAIKQCEGKQPMPILQSLGNDLTVKADPDALVMAFTHLLSNAQEACVKNGNIDIEFSQNSESIKCRITDTGSGMDQEFIDNRLFKPFDSTKKNQGMQTLQRSSLYLWMSR